MIDTEPLETDATAKAIKTAREHKTEQSDKKGTLHRSVAKHEDLFKDYLRDNHSLQHQRTRNKSEYPQEKTDPTKLTQEDVRYLNFIVENLSKVLSF